MGLTQWNLLHRHIRLDLDALGDVVPDCWSQDAKKWQFHQLFGDLVDRDLFRIGPLSLLQIIHHLSSSLLRLLLGFFVQAEVSGVDSVD